MAFSKRLKQLLLLEPISSYFEKKNTPIPLKRIGMQDAFNFSLLQKKISESQHASIFKDNCSI